MLSAQHDELPQYVPHAHPTFASQLYEPRADESAKSYETQSIIYELRQDSPRKLLQFRYLSRDITFSQRFVCYTISNRVKMTWHVLRDTATSLIIMAGPPTKKIQQSPLISLIAKAYEKVHITSVWTYINPGISCSARMHADTHTHTHTQGNMHAYLRYKQSCHRACADP